MKDLIGDTIEKIKKQHIAPEPKWKYSVRKYGIWVLFGLIVVFGAGSLSAAYYLLTSLDWDLYLFMHRNIFSYSLSIFPYFWAVLIGIFILVAFFDIRRTETGYRFSFLKISLVTIGSVILLGVGMSFLGLGGRVNSMMAINVPYYGKHMMVTKESQWSNPASGFLAGTIISISQGELVLDDLQRKRWNIVLSEKTLIRPRADVSSGQMVKIIGSQMDGNNFNASEIRPWMGMGQGMMGTGQSVQGNVGGEKMMNRGVNRGGMMRGN